MNFLKRYYVILKLKSIYLYNSGFETKMLSVTDLEEYWPYKFQVNAATVKGNTTSDFSSVFQTKEAGRLISVFFKPKLYVFLNLEQLSI